MSESNIFSEKAGFSVHFKIEEEDLNKLKNNTETFIAWMKEQGYVHDTTRDKPGRGGGGRAPAPPPTIQANGQTIEIKCGRCGGPVWDNRERNALKLKQAEAAGEKPKIPPAFKCKDDKACGWILWGDKVDNYINELTDRDPVAVDLDDLPRE